MSDKPGALNKWGAYICGHCRSGNHLGTRHIGLCSCSCDGQHDAKGNLLSGYTQTAREAQ